MRNSYLLPSALTFAAALLACQSKPVLAPPPAGLVAVVERDNELVVVRKSKDEWVPEKHLPKAARALRFSPDGATVSWVQDDSGDGGVTPVGYFQSWGAEKPESVGPLGLRTRAAMGLMPATGGQLAYLSLTGDLQLRGGTQASLGRGSDPIPNGKGDWAFLNQNGCLASTDGLVPLGKLCADAIRPLQYGEGELLARDNHGLWQVTREKIGRVLLKEVVDAQVRKHDTLLVVHRVDERGKPVEAVTLMRPGEPQAEATRGAIIISARFDQDGGVLVVRAPSRSDLYQLMLAHAPEEFGGEALAGHAYRYSPTHLRETEVPGLELERVRVLFRTR